MNAKIKIVSLTIFTSMCLILSAYALTEVETGQLVTLKKEIREGVEAIQKMQIGLEEKAQKRNKEIQSTVNRLINEKNADKKDRTANEYYKLRAEELRDMAGTIHGTREQIIGIAAKMKRLQKAMGGANVDGVTFSPEEKAATGASMRGIAAGATVLRQVIPQNKEFDYVTTNLKLQDERFRRLFNPEEEYTLEEQIQILASIAATLKSSLMLMDAERKSLLADIYYVVQGGIVRYTDDLMIDIDKFIQSYIGGGNNNSDDVVRSQIRAANATRSINSSLNSQDLSSVGHYE